MNRKIRSLIASAVQAAMSMISVMQTVLLRSLVSIPRPIVKDRLQRILIVRLDELGDLVMTLPLIQALKAGLPDAELTLLVNQSVVGIVEGMTGLRVIGVPVACNKWIRPFVLPFRHYGFVRRELRDKEFDICLLPRRDADDVCATILAYFTRSSRRMSFTERSTPRKLATNRSYDSLLTDVLPVPKLQHETLTNLSMLTAIGLPFSSYDQLLPLPASAVQFAEQMLPEAPTSYVAICPTSGHSALKQWGVERFAEVAGRLAASGRTIILLGSSADASMGQVIEAACKDRCVNMIGKTSLVQMAALLNRCTAFLGNDAGPMHVASALGIATVGILGSSCWHQFGPWGPRHTVLVREIACSPCVKHLKNRCDVCVHGSPLCLYQISPSEVFQSVQAALMPLPRSLR